MNDSNIQHCPKCQTEKSGDSCDKCGLVFDKYNPELAQRGVPDHVVELWNNTEANWQDKAAHALFVEQALISDAAGYVASCYRKKNEL